MLANILSRYWWMTLLRGVIWVLFGLVVFSQPAISLVTLTLLFGAFALVDGIAAVATAIGGREEHENWWVLLLVGLCGIGAGVVTFLMPAVTALAAALPNRDLGDRHRPAPDRRGDPAAQGDRGRALAHPVGDPVSGLWRAARRAARRRGALGALADRLLRDRIRRDPHLPVLQGAGIREPLRQVERLTSVGLGSHLITAC
jgi:Short repeat of unknown function (DUF308)